MPIMARQPNGEYVEICVIPSWIGGTQHDISEIKLPTDERIFKNWRTYEGTLPVTLSHTGEGNLISYKIWGNTEQAGTPTPENPIVPSGYVLAEPKTGIVNEPLMKIGDYADTIDSTQTTAQIPTSAGETTISYGGTGAQPEKVEFTYKLGV